MATKSLKFRKRTHPEIQQLLSDKQIHKQSAMDFCKLHCISKQTYYNWEKRYGVPEKRNFIPLNVDPAVSVEPQPFCEIQISTKTTLRFFAPVDAGYLKSLIY